MTGGNAERAKVIRFWRAVELFSPPPVPKASRERWMYSVKFGDPLPWDSTHELQRVQLRHSQTWQHVVYLGIYPLESVFEVLARVFEPDSESFDQRPGGESALAAFTVSNEGRPILGSEVLSSCAWGVGRALHPGPDATGWLDGFDGVESMFNGTFEDLVAPDPDDQGAIAFQQQGIRVGRPIGWGHVEGCLATAADLLSLDPPIG